jgi:hypothetical protein
MNKFLNIGLAFKRLFGGKKQTEVTGKPLTTAGQINAKAGIAEVETPQTLTIWTIERNRYAAPRALCTDIEVYPSTSVGLCEDIMGYVLDTPSGESVVIEARTGSLVGHSLEVVRDGVREMTKIQLNVQLDTARKEFNRMKKSELSNDEFWKSLKMGSAEIEVSQDFQE